MTAPDRIAVADAYRKWKEQSPEIYQVVQQEGERPFAAGFSTGYSSALEVTEHEIESLEESMDELAQALERMAERYILYAGGSDMPFAGDKEVALLETARAALARYRGGA